MVIIVAGGRLEVAGRSKGPAFWESKTSHFGFMCLILASFSLLCPLLLPSWSLFGPFCANLGSKLALHGSVVCTPSVPGLRKTWEFQSFALFSRIAPKVSTMTPKGDPQTPQPPKEPHSHPKVAQRCHKRAQKPPKKIPKVPRSAKESPTAPHECPDGP